LVNIQRLGKGLMLPMQQQGDSSMSDQQAGGTSANKLIIPALLILLAILVFLGWRGVFSPTLPGTPGSANAPSSEAPAGGSAGAGNAGQTARPAIPAAPAPPDLAAPNTEAARTEANAAAAQAAMIAPRFDVVRVGARGSAVIAGRAAPGAEVILFADNGRELGRARADRRGEFVILPAESLPPGTMELSLRARLGDQEMAGPDTVVLVVPDTAAQMAEAPRPAAPAQTAPAAPATEPSSTAPAPAPTGPLAVLIPSRPEAAGPRLLQVPEPTPAARGAPRLGIDSVEYDQAGSMRFAGGAPPGTTLRLYVDERYIGDAVADAQGRWALMPETQPSIGRHRLRVDQISPGDGRVLARAEVPFQREELPAEAFAQQRIVVQPGNNLWRIARATYGRGTRYTVIYQANKDQIADPNKIYPGQVFALPTAQPAPAASSRSR
jgi:nucleoid-associated protein YgaU